MGPTLLFGHFGKGLGKIVINGGVFPCGCIKFKKVQNTFSTPGLQHSSKVAIAFLAKQVLSRQVIPSVRAFRARLSIDIGFLGGGGVLMNSESSPPADIFPVIPIFGYHLILADSTEIQDMDLCKLPGKLTLRTLPEKVSGKFRKFPES